MEKVMSNEAVAVPSPEPGYCSKATYQIKKVVMRTDKLEVLLKINQLRTNISNYFVTKTNSSNILVLNKVDS
jgi:hypothetical protein